MPGMMRSRVTGCLCPDCGGWTADRASEKRAVARWRDEYETHPEIAVPDDECPRDLRPCPVDTNECCTGALSRSLTSADTDAANGT